MTARKDMARTIRSLAAQRGVYRQEAYFFVLESLENAMEARTARGHISGGGLLDWIRKLGTERYGVMAGDVFNAWGLNGTIDFGRIVFHLVEAGLLKRREQDSLSDFIDKFDFQEAFALKAYQERG